MYDLLEYIGYTLYSILSRILPLFLAYRLADLVGYLVFKSGKEDNKRRAYIMQRIYESSPRMQESSGKIDFYYAYRLVCKNIQLFNRDLVDFFRSSGLNKNNIDSFVKIEGLEYLNNSLKNAKGIIFASAHMGSWEMIGIISAIKGYPVYGMVWEVGNKLVADMFRKIRLKKGVGTVRSSSLRHILELLQKNKIIGIMLDVPGGIKGVPYSLWGYNINLPRGPAAISKDTGAEILVVVTLRSENGGYKLYVEKPKVDGTVEEITIGLFSIIKKYIESDPAQWHWIRYFFYANSRESNANYRK